MGTGEVVRQWVSELFDREEKEYVFKVLLIGDCVGKSSLLLRFCTNTFVEESAMQLIPMTIGLDVKSKIVEVEGSDGKEQVTLNIWDTAGQDRFRKMNEQYLPSADAVILLYDVRSLHTFKQCRSFVEDIINFCDPDVVKILGSCLRQSLTAVLANAVCGGIVKISSLESPRNIIWVPRTFYVKARSLHKVGNKDDHDQSKKTVASERARDFACSVGFGFVETSAKDNRNVHQLFQLAAQLCFDQRKLSERSPQS